MIAALLRRLFGTASASHREPRFDPAALDEMTNELGAEPTGHIVRTFVQSTGRDIERMAALRDAPTELHVLAHSLKSSAKMVGAVRLSRLAAVIEDKTDRGEPVASSDLKALADAFREYRDWRQVRMLAAE